MRTAMALLLALLVAGGCQSGRRYTPDEVPQFFLQPQEAPFGTLFRTDQSGSATLSDFAHGDADLAARWGQLGFKGGQVSVFMTSAQPPDPSAITIGNGAMVFESADGAHRALELLRTLGIPRLTSGAHNVGVQNLGEEAFAVTFARGPVALPGAICAFRIANAVFQVAAGGEAVKVADVIAIARTIAKRASS
jgi:hypothetical protein